MMTDSNYGVMTARMPHCPLTCCADMDQMRDMYLTSGCTASYETSSYLCSSSSPGYHQYHQSYAPMHPSTCHTVGWDAYQHCSSYRPRVEAAGHPSTCVPSLYPVSQSSHTSPAPVGIPPYKYTSSTEIPPLVAGNTFTQPHAGILCNEQQQQQQQIMSPTDHKIGEDKIKVEGDQFQSSLRVVTPEGLQPPEYRSRLKHRLPRRDRLNFTDFQLMRLEESFSEKKYIIGADRKSLADELGISEIQVKNWYQNRRTRWKRERKPDSK